MGFCLKTFIAAFSLMKIHTWACLLWILTFFNEKRFSWFLGMQLSWDQHYLMILKTYFFFHVVLFFLCPTSSERLQIYVSAKRGMQWTQSVFTCHAHWCVCRVLSYYRLGFHTSLISGFLDSVDGTLTSSTSSHQQLQEGYDASGRLLWAWG